MNNSHIKPKALDASNIDKAVVVDAKDNSTKGLCGTKFYKVVAVFNGKKCSYNISANEGANRRFEEQGLKLHYSTEKVTTPVIEGSKLFVFSNLEKALKVARYSNQEVWEAEVTNPQRVFYFPTIAALSTKELYWKDRRQGKNIKKYGLGMSHTVLVDSVRLVKKIK